MKLKIEIDSNIGGWTDRQDMKDILERLAQKIASTKDISGTVSDASGNYMGTWQASGEEIDAERRPTKCSQDGCINEIMDNSDYCKTHQHANCNDCYDTLTGEDAERLLNDLEDHCSPEEADRRLKRAHELMQELMRPKGKK